MLYVIKKPIQISSEADLKMSYWLTSTNCGDNIVKAMRVKGEIDYWHLGAVSQMIFWIKLLLE